jgi:hypothetical protein
MSRVFGKMCLHTKGEDVNKTEHFHARASKEDLNLTAKLAKTTKLSSSMAVWHAVRFALANIGMFQIWIKKNGNEDM